jgi:hypothetical protein
MMEDFFNINEWTAEKEAILRGEKYEPAPEEGKAASKVSKPKTQKRKNSKKQKI